MDDKSKDYMNNHAKWYRKAYIERFGVDPYAGDDRESPKTPSPGFTEGNYPLTTRRFCDTLEA